MDPQTPTVHPQLRIVNNTVIILQQPNPLTSKSTIINQLNKELEKQLSSKQKQKQISQFNWKWLCYVKSQDVVRVFDLLPDSLKAIYLGGAEIDDGVIRIVCNRFKGLEVFILYYGQQQYHNIGWDLNYQIYIKNSPKLFRQSQKWLHKVSSKIVQILPNSITHLSLRGINLGKDKNAIKTLLQNCPQLLELDVGQTQLTDQHFCIFAPIGVKQQQNMKNNKEIGEDKQDSVVHKFSRSVRCFKIDCNRVSRKAIEIVFPHLFQQHHHQCYPNLRILDISSTKINGVFELLFKLSELEYLSMSYVQLQQQQILNASHHFNNLPINNQAEQKQNITTKPKLTLKQLAIQYISLSDKAIDLLLQLYSNSNIESLTLASIEKPQHSHNDHNHTQQNKMIKSNEQMGYQINLKGYNIVRLNLSYNRYLSGCGCLPNVIASVQDTVQVLKISGTAVDSWAQLMLISQCKKLRWLQISHLEQLVLATSNQIVNSSQQKQKTQQKEQKKETSQTIENQSEKHGTEEKPGKGATINQNKNQNKNQNQNQNKNQNKNKKQEKAQAMLHQLVISLPNLQYIEAYELLNKSQIKLFHQFFHTSTLLPIDITQIQQPNQFVAVLDAFGPMLFTAKHKHK